MSISKSLRFDVFARDLFTCRYCGQRSPDVILECDHILPRSLGGADDILNLVTSCFDCNRGKCTKSLPCEVPPSVAASMRAAPPEVLFDDDWSEHVLLPARLFSVLFEGLLPRYALVMYGAFVELCDPRRRIWSGNPFLLASRVGLQARQWDKGMRALKKQAFIAVKHRTRPSRVVEVKLLDFFSESR